MPALCNKTHSPSTSVAFFLRLLSQSLVPLSESFWQTFFDFFDVVVRACHGVEGLHLDEFCRKTCRGFFCYIFSCVSVENCEHWNILEFFRETNLEVELGGWEFLRTYLANMGIFHIDSPALHGTHRPFEPIFGAFFWLYVCQRLGQKRSHFVFRKVKPWRFFLVFCSHW